MLQKNVTSVKDNKFYHLNKGRERKTFYLEKSTMKFSCLNSSLCRRHHAIMEMKAYKINMWAI